MHSSPPIERQWHILIALMSRRQGQTIKELSGEVGVDDRTIRRDLNTLRKAGFPLTEHVSDYGRKHWKMADEIMRVPIHFTWSEAVSLYLGRRLLDPLAGTEFWRSAQSAFAKIRAMLGEAALSQLNKVSSAFLQTMPGRSDYGEKAELIDRLMMAIEDHRIAFVAYQSERSTEPVSLELYPYGIVYHKGSLYLVAHSRDHEKRHEEKRHEEKRGLPHSTIKTSDENRQTHGDCPSFSASAIRHFKIDRVTDVDVQTLQFTPDSEFSLQKHLANSFGVWGADESESGHPKKIRIRFASEAARYVQEKTWHASQVLKKEKDGSVVLEVHLDNTNEIKSWALSFGPRATVLEPESLRDEIEADVEAVLKNYRTSEGKVRRGEVRRGRGEG